MTKDEVNTRVDAELLTGESAKDIAEKYDISYAAVALRQRNLSKTDIHGDILDENITKATLSMIRDKIVEDAPKLAKQADMIIDGLEGIKLLNKDIQDGLSKVVKLANEMLDGDLDEEGNLKPISKRDLQILAGILTSVYSSINTKSTVVNVAQTNVTSSGENLQFFRANVRPV